MLTEYALNALWPVGPARPMGQQREELLERCRPMASSALELVEAMDTGETDLPNALDDWPPSMVSEPPSSPEERNETEDPELEQVERQIAWHQLVDDLDPRLKRVVELRYYHGLSQLECGRRLGVSQTQVSRLERSALERLRVESMGT